MQGFARLPLVLLLPSPLSLLLLSLLLPYNSRCPMMSKQLSLKNVRGKACGVALRLSYCRCCCCYCSYRANSSSSSSSWLKGVTATLSLYTFMLSL